MTMSPSTSMEKDMVSFPSTQITQANTSAEQGGRQYTCKPKYYSGWEILPDLVVNILRGCESKQEFKMHKYGLYQGTIRVILFNDNAFNPMVGNSGSLEVAYMVEPVRNFLTTSSFSSFFGLKDEETISLIHFVFNEITRGTESKTFSVSDGSEFRFQYHRQHVFIQEVNQNPGDNHRSTLELADKFFNSINLNLVFGKNIKGKKL